MRIKRAEHHQGTETEDDEKCVLGSTRWLLIGFSVRLESKATRAEYVREWKRQKVANETKTERCMWSSAGTLQFRIVYQLIVRASQG